MKITTTRKKLVKRCIKYTEFIEDPFSAVWAEASDLAQDKGYGSEGAGDVFQDIADELFKTDDPETLMDALENPSCVFVDGICCDGAEKSDEYLDAKLHDLNSQLKGHEDSVRDLSEEMKNVRAIMSKLPKYR